MSQANSIEHSSPLFVADAEIKKVSSLTSSEGKSNAKDMTSKISLPEKNEDLPQKSIPQEQSIPEEQEKKTLKLWSMHQENATTSVPVTVSTTNSTLSILKKAQQHAKFLPVTNSTLLPGLNATFPLSLPPSNMPQLAPVTNW